MKRLPSLFLFIVLILCLHTTAIATTATLEKEELPEITLIIPENEEYRNYLGLKGNPGETFTLNDIDADVLLIELFSMYCPFCQEEAPNVNALYETMVDFSKPDYTVKIIGLAANNSEFEVDHFRKTYDVKFPLFPDQEMAHYNALGGKGTPGFIGCKKTPGNSYSIILRQSGGFYQVEEFFNELLRKSGYN